MTDKLPKENIREHMLRKLIEELNDKGVVVKGGIIEDIQDVLLPWINTKLKEEKKEEVVEEECSICLENIKEKNMCVLDCEHKFHLRCIMKLHQTGMNYNNICPLCRQNYCDRREERGGIRGIHDIVVNMETTPLSDLIHNTIHMPSNRIEFLNNLTNMEEEMFQTMKRVFDLDENKFATLMCILFEI